MRLVREPKRFHIHWLSRRYMYSRSHGVNTLPHAHFHMPEHPRTGKEDTATALSSRIYTGKTKQTVVVVVVVV